MLITPEETLTTLGFGVGMPKTEVENCATVATILRLRREGVTKLGVLNFASAKTPGSGFDHIIHAVLDTSKAQSCINAFRQLEG